ncbi:MAG: 3-hydroxyacyl-CoA dehydrogenase family protein [Rhodospirillales bacterium]
MGRTLAYAAKLVPEAADDITSIDEAMRLGYNWKWGPFELIDKVGVDWFVSRLRAENIAVAPILEAAAGRTFYRVEGRQAPISGTGRRLPQSHAAGWRAAAGGSETRGKAGAEERQCGGVGHRRRRAVL